MNRSPKRYAAITACVGVVTFYARGTADVCALTVFSVSANFLARSAPEILVQDLHLPWTQTEFDWLITFGDFGFANDR